MSSSPPSRLPFVVAALVAASSLLWALHLAGDPEPFAAGPGAVLAVSLAALSVVCGAGILIARARWSRLLAVGLAAGSLTLGAVTPLDPMVVCGVVFGGLALASAAGPWLRGWLRQLPAAQGPPPAAVGAVFGLALLPAWTAVVKPHGLGIVDWMFVGIAPVLAWGLSRGSAPALWAVRIAVPSLAVAAAVVDPLPAGILIAAAAALPAGLAWRNDVLLAVSPVAARHAPPVPFPPELVDPEMLRAAGFDDSGRPLEGE